MVVAAPSLLHSFVTYKLLSWFSAHNSRKKALDKKFGSEPKLIQHFDISTALAKIKTVTKRYPKILFILVNIYMFYIASKSSPNNKLPEMK